MTSSRKQIVTGTPTAAIRFGIPNASMTASIVFVLFAAAFLIYSNLWREAPVTTPDSPSYLRLAHDLRQGHLSELSLRTPGLPIFLLLTGQADRPGKGFFRASLLIYFAAISILAYLLHRLRASRSMVIGFVVVALLPPYIEMTGYIGSETLATSGLIVTFAGAVAWMLTQKDRYLVLFGFAAAYCALVRPTFQLIAVLLVSVMVACRALGWWAGVVRTRAWWPLALSIIPSIVALGGWSLVNYLRFDYAATSKIAPFSLSIKTAPLLEYLPDRYGPLREILIRYRDKTLVKPFSDHTGIDYIFTAMPEVVRYHNGDEVAALKDLQEAFLYLIETKPVSYLNLAAQSMGWYWLPIDTPLSNRGSNFGRAVWTTFQMSVVALWTLQFVCLIGTGCWDGTHCLAGARSERRLLSGRRASLFGIYLLASSVIVYTGALSCLLATGEPRYRQPTDLLIVFSLAIGWTIWRDAGVRGADDQVECIADQGS